jgi:hypothetical protein
MPEMDGIRAVENRVENRSVGFGDYADGLRHALLVDSAAGDGGRANQYLRKPPMWRSCSAAVRQQVQATRLRRRFAQDALNWRL